MLCWRTVHMMKWGQLFWIAFCVVRLCGAAADSLTDNSTAVSLAVATSQSSTGSKAPTSIMGSAAPTQDSPEATAQPASGSPSSPELSSGHSLQSSTHPSTHPSTQTITQTSQTPTALLGNHSHLEDISSGAATTLSPTLHPRTTAAANLSATALLSSTATLGLEEAVSEVTTQLHTSGGVSKPITCHNIKEVHDSGALCLRLNKSHTCKHFLDTKGSDLWRAICEEDAHRVPPPCEIKLAMSEVDQECLLLVLDGNTDPATDVLRKSHWEKFGIKSLERDRVRNHQNFTRKTLTALVTSGLLLAALGTAGYFLMRRRSWSPAGQRLDEDHYDLETGSQGSPTPQEKPSANGAQENGASRNGRGTAQSLADTSM